MDSHAAAIEPISQKYLDSTPTPFRGRTELHRRVLHLVMLGNEGHLDAGTALTRLRELWLASPHHETPRDAELEFSSSLSSNIRDADALRVRAAREHFRIALSGSAPDLTAIDPPPAPVIATSSDVLKRFPKLDLKAILDPSRPPRQWMWDGVVPVGDQGSIVAWGGTGKSLLVLSLVIAAQRGETQFIGRPVSKPRRTLYLDLENSEDDWAERLTDLGVTEAEIDSWGESLIVLSFPNFGGLDTVAGAAQLMQVIDAYDIQSEDLIVFDSMQRITTGEENSNDTTRKLYEHTTAELKRRKITAIRTDNTGKDAAKGARGGSAKIDDVGSSWALSKESSASKLSDVYTLTNLKLRSSGASDEIVFTTDDSSGRLRYVPSAVRTFSDLMDTVRLVLDTAKIPHTAAQRAVWELVTDFWDGSTPTKRLPPGVTRRLVRKEQADRIYAVRAFGK